MNVLIVGSANSGHANIFVIEQAESLRNLHINIDYYLIIGKGVKGYLSNLSGLKKKIEEFKPDLIHAHYGLSGLLSIMQQRIPVIITFHNGETLSFLPNILSSLASIFSKYNIFVAEHIYKKLKYHDKQKHDIIPCGIDLDKINIIDKVKAIEKSKLNSRKKNILFGGAFNNLRKNYPLANDSVKLLKRNDINIIELKGYKREEVYLLLNACDLLLLPTRSEGSPQIIKEAMACNCPIVSTDVGDIKEIISDTDGCYITSIEPNDVADKIKMAIDFGKRTNGREKIRKYDNKVVTERILEVYNKVLANSQ